MLGFIQNLFGLQRVLAPPAHPIGVDFGTDSLRLAQVQEDGSDFKLCAAASVEVPPEVRADADLRLKFFALSTAHLLAQAPFRGRQAVLGLPASVVHIQQLSLRPMDDTELKDTVFREARRQFPFDPSHALVRHSVAGKYQQYKSILQDPTLQRVIVMAADTRWVKRYIAAAQAARLNIVAMNFQPMALLDCFAHIYRRTHEAESTHFYVDVGSSGTRAMVARGTHLLFARNIAIGGDHLTRSVAESLGIGFHDARTLRIKLGAGPATQADRVEAAIYHTMEQLIRELDACRKDHESTFPEFPIKQLVFVGGEARQGNLCQHIAKQLDLPCQTGDSLCRMAGNSKIGIESAIDRRHSQPAWAAAIGLSIGPATDEE
ncbi:MAG TPA: pilus assembly protein PilM [Tepidisphaeraceae bacterium]|jgi:type IV pilus assembly protein PilM|nr:pilus assembly protein PilM [Tepidisphaeraceae bacterium]